MFPYRGGELLLIPSGNVFPARSPLSDFLQYKGSEYLWHLCHGKNTINWPFLYMENKDLFVFPPPILYLCVMGILELLKRRDELSDIAMIMYGDIYVSHEDFWNSPLENEMREVEESLHNLGWQSDEPTNEMLEASVIILQDLLNKDS